MQHPQIFPVHPVLRQFLQENVHGALPNQVKWSPRVDVIEEAERFLILADIPGIDPQDIEIELERNTLVVRGSRNKRIAGEGEQTIRSERWNGTFDRRFEISDLVDRDNIKASGAHGVLEISLPKRAEFGPRKISIS